MWGDGETSRISPAESAADMKYQKNRVKMLDFSETTFHNIASDSLSREIDERRLTDIVERAKDFCLMHGEHSDSSAVIITIQIMTTINFQESA